MKIKEIAKRLNELFYCFKRQIEKGELCYKCRYASICNIFHKAYMLGREHLEEELEAKEFFEALGREEREAEEIELEEEY